MSSQRQDSLFLKCRRLQYINSNERPVAQASILTNRSKSVTQEVKNLGVIPGSRRDLGDQHSNLAELPRTPHSKRKPDCLPHLTSCANKGYAPDPKLNLSVVSKRVFQGNSAVEGSEHRQTRHTGLVKKSPETTACEAQGKRRTLELLNKARKQTEKASNLLDIRQLQKQEVVKDTEHPRLKHPQQQQKSLEELRRGPLEGGNDKEPPKYGECFALEENTVLQGKKIKPYSRRSVPIECSQLVREQESGKEPKPVPSGQDELKAKKAAKGKKAQTQFLEITPLQGKEKVMGQNLQAEAKPQLLKRKRMQAMEMLPEPHHDRGLRLEDSRKEVKLSPRDIKQGALETNLMRPERWPRVEVWNHMVEGSPVVLAPRDHNYLPQGSKDQSAPKSRLSLLSKSCISYYR